MESQIGDVKPIISEQISNQETIHTVKRGDNLESIAKQYGVTVNDIVKVNNIKNPNIITINQQLRIPKKQTDTPKPNIPNIPNLPQYDSLENERRKYEIGKTKKILGKDFDKKDYETYRFASSCLPESFQGFLVYLRQPFLAKSLGLTDDELYLFAQISMGIIQRESSLGTDYKDSDKWGASLRTMGLGMFAPDSQSLGSAQYTKNTWDKYGLEKKLGDYDDLINNDVAQVVATLLGLTDRYKRALQAGLKKEPSVNQILDKYRVLTSGIKGTGNNALDLAIMSHNFKEEDCIVKHCTTSHPLYSAPCNKSTSKPFETVSSFENWKKDSEFMKKVPSTEEHLKKFPGELKVNQSNLLPNYYPNRKGGAHTSIGYLQKVVEYSKGFPCLKKDNNAVR